MKLNENLKLGIWIVVITTSIVVQCYHPLTAPERAKIFYDCRVSEISPDVPPKVREECRKLMEKR